MFGVDTIIQDKEEVSAPLGSIYQKINEKFPGRNYEINFQGGFIYNGSVNDNFEFEGLGTLIAPPNSEIKWISGQNFKEVTGLFVPGYGLVCEILFEGIEEDMKRDLKLVSNTYFENRERIEKLYNSPLDVKYEWLTLKGKGDKIVRYKGGWVDYVVNGPCKIQIGDGPEINGIAQNGVVFNAKINFSFYKELKSNADDKGKTKFKKKVKFKNGNM